MFTQDAFQVFESLTEKQRLTLALASRHLTSKEIAQELDVAPVTVDKRIEGLRARLGNITRPELIRLFQHWCAVHDQAIDAPIILANLTAHPASPSTQQDDPALLFSDSVPFDARASWDRGQGVLRPGMRPSDLGVAGKLLFMIGGAVAVMMLAVLCMAFADALMSILVR